jgi:triacylglycerol lipase
MDFNKFENIYLKYPIVLVHGIACYDRKKLVNINFWGRIPETLRKYGIKVYFGNTDAWGTYESNSLMLKSTVEKILNETGTEKVNIIAHSKGGLDSRYLIWKYDFGSKIASLTTVSTPHHGAEIADLLYGQKIIHSSIAKKVLKILGKLYGDFNPDLYMVNYELTTERMRKFNEDVKPDQNVYYQSLYTTMKNSFDDIMFFYSYRYIEKLAGANDGLVSERSANWGNNVNKIDGGISHCEILDFKRRKISGVNIPNIYVKIARGLSKMGF